MTFIHGYLLGGLLLAGVPILLHLIMRQKPKRLPFPAFRFLKARQRTNQRRLRLQHLLLLLLRMAVIAALCLALARPRLFSGRLGLNPDRPVTAVLLFDTSASMGYTVAGQTRLDDARQRARELFDEMDPASRVAVLDAGDDGQDAFLPLAEARSRLEALRVRPIIVTLERAVERAVQMLRQDSDDEDAPPRLLYVLSDRTRASWNATGTRPEIPPGMQAVLVDVGAEPVRDLSIEQVEVIPPVVAPGGRFEVRVRLRGTPGGHESELSCQIDNDPNPDRPPDRRPIALGKEQTADVVVFEREAPTPPPTSPLDAPFQITCRLGARDALPFNNVRHATFLVRGSRKLLTLVADRSAARIWEAVHLATRAFTPEVKTLDEAAKLTAKDLAGYSVIALFQTPAIPADLVKLLTTYVREGGGLVVVPGGEEMLPDLAAFNKQLADLLPGPLVRLASTPPGKPVLWARFSGAHPLMAPFVKWSRSADPDFARDELRPFVRRYWVVGPLAKGASGITAYAAPGEAPALAERELGRGKVVLFTSPMDIRHVEPGRTSSPQWNNYWQDSSFGLVLVDRVCRYLAGEVQAPRLNFLTGETPLVAVPRPFDAPVSLTGPELGSGERMVTVPPDGAPAALPQAIAAGNYQITDAKNRLVAAFSLDVPWQESDLDRVPVEELERTFGPKGVVQVGQSLGLREALATGRPLPIELLPYLLLLVLLVLTVESLLGNRFYRRTPDSAGPAPTPAGQEAS